MPHQCCRCRGSDSCRTSAAIVVDLLHAAPVLPSSWICFVPHPLHPPSSSKDMDLTWPIREGPRAARTPHASHNTQVSPAPTRRSRGGSPTRMRPHPHPWPTRGGYDERIDKGRGSRGRRRARRTDPERSGCGGAGRRRRARRVRGAHEEEHGEESLRDWVEERGGAPPRIASGWGGARRLRVWVRVSMLPGGGRCSPPVLEGRPATAGRPGHSGGAAGLGSGWRKAVGPVPGVGVMAVGGGDPSPPMPEGWRRVVGRC